VIDNFVFHKFIESNRIQKYKAFPGDANVRKSLPFAGILCGQADGSDGSSSKLSGVSGRHTMSGPC